MSMPTENCDELREMLEGIKKLQVIVKEKKAELKIQESILKESQERFMEKVEEKLNEADATADYEEQLRCEKLVVIP